MLPAMRIANAAIAARLFAPRLAGATRERLVIAHLAADQALLEIETCEGEVDAAALPVRDILHQALRLDAAALVIAHNHPSGDPEPSPADLAATRRLAEAGRSLGIRLHDHLIFTRGGCRSFRALGLL